MSHSKRVLCIDDSVDLLDLHRFYLDDNPDISVTAVQTADQALRKIESEDFDCVVSDFDLVQTTGLELFQQLKATGCNIPFFLFTTHTDLDDRVAATDVKEVFQKNNIPDVYDDISTAIKQTVEREPSTGASGLS